MLARRRRRLASLFQKTFHVPGERYFFGGRPIAHHPYGLRANAVADESEYIDGGLLNRAQGGDGKHRVPGADAIYHVAGERGNLMKAFAPAVAQTSLSASSNHKPLGSKLAT